MYTIVTDSCCDLNPQIVSSFSGLVVLPLTYTIAGVTSTQALDTPQNVRAYYDRLRAGEACVTSQVSPGAFYDEFKALAAKGEQVLGILFSSALSGTYNTACVAKDMVLEEYPDAQIELIDSLAASAGEGLLVYDALLRRDAGMPLAENAQCVRDTLQTVAHWFTVDDLHFLKRGGRCSPSAAFFGTMLHIKPVLHVDEQGRLIARSKVRGRHQALRAIASKFGELGADPAQTVFISHGDCEEDAVFVRDELVRMYGVKPENVMICVVGPVIGSHSGPGTIALFFRGRDRG